MTRNVWVRFRTLLISEEVPGASPLAPFAFDLLRPYFEMIMNYISYNGQVLLYFLIVLIYLSKEFYLDVAPGTCKPLSRSI